MIQIGFCDDDLSILSELRVLLDRYRVERYGGLYSFSVKEGKFVLRVSL